MFRSSNYRFVTVLIIVALVPFLANAQSAPTTPPAVSSIPETGFLSYVDFGGSSNADGHLLTLGFAAGYQFNSHVGIMARIPIYFASGTTSGTTSTTSQPTTSSHSGVGDPAFALFVAFPNHVLDYQTRVTTWIPVADISSGFSTGEVLVDWTNRFSRQFGRLAPFGQVGIGNTVPDTPLFILPYTAQGFNARFEGGTGIALTKIFSTGASAYYVLPSGEQHVYSRMMSSNGSGGAMVGGMGGNVFMMNPVTVGSDLTRDRGFSTWLAAGLPHYVDMEVGYTRSTGYDLNTVSFGLGFNLGEAMRHRHK